MPSPIKRPAVRWESLSACLSDKDKVEAYLVVDETGGMDVDFESWDAGFRIADAFMCFFFFRYLNTYRLRA